jgi:hypothetical protein
MTHLARARPLLDLIARHESESAASDQGVESGYDVVVWQAFHVCRPERPLSGMTVGEVLAWQLRAIREYRAHRQARTGYSAAGRYQIIRGTLQGLVDSGATRLDETFDADTQDGLGFALLRRRGFMRWLGGRMTDDRFADALSQEWASLPFNTGRSFYAGDAHGNRSLVSRAEVMAVLQTIKNNSQ